MARALTAVAVAGAVVLAAGGCGGAGGDSGTIRFLVFGDPEELAAYRAVVDAYAEREPDARVQLVEASDRSDLIARLSTSFAGGTPPDLFLINYRFYGQFAAKDVLEPLQERVDGSDALELEEFYPEALDAFRWRGELMCLPQNVSSLVVYYNRDLFERFRTPEPREGWTWTDLVVTASRLTRDEQGRPVQGQDPEIAGTVRPAIYGLGVEPTLIRIAPFLWSNGASLVDHDERPTRLAFDSPEALTVLRAFFELRSTYGVVPTDAEVEAEDDEGRFANGRLAMLLSSRRSTTTFRTIEGFDWDVAPLPVFEEPAGILHSDAYCMTKAADQDAAWRFVEFALGPEGQRILARTGRIVPSLKAVAQSDAFLDPRARPLRSQVFLDAIPTIRRVPSISTWPEIEDAAEGILENGMYLGKRAEDVARELDSATRPLFARAERP